MKCDCCGKFLTIADKPCSAPHGLPLFVCNKCYEQLKESKVIDEKKETKRRQKMTKEQKTIKEQKTQIENLTNELSRVKSDLECANKYREHKELADINAIFDLLNVPRRVKNTYHDLTSNARLTLFLAQLNGIKVEQPKEGD